MEHPERKRIRLEGYDYNTPGYYFLTVCTVGKEKLFCDIIQSDPMSMPRVLLTQYGEVVLRQLDGMSNFYEDIRIDKYVIMPNHVHMIVRLLGTVEGVYDSNQVNSKISRFVGTFKRFCNKAFGRNVWQSRSYDHIIRGEKDYAKIWEYIDTNPIRWNEDCFYK